ncbi:caspase-8 isoform X2 [Toxotes jaculatrix]|uniref:caspase-8 isoform X2 n=1 Tax=Toxotes jaculatrix TaxID=941984 RepID=UPI001B3A82E0|nr:caspase-8 isoform X2 [Toxotes jaculatrix]
MIAGSQSVDTDMSGGTLGVEPVMDRLKLSRIDEELESSEVAALCFLCRDVVNRKRLEGVGDAKQLFLRLEEKGLLDNSFFLSQLLSTIRRTDLLNLLETDNSQPEETDASPALSAYRVMLYKIYEDMTQENLEKMKFLLSSKLGRRQTEASNTALDLFAEMEKTGLLSDTNLHELLRVLRELDQQLVLTVQRHMDEAPRQQMRPAPPHVSMDDPRVSSTSQPAQPLPPFLSIVETQPSSEGESTSPDADSDQNTPSAFDTADDYALTHYPRGYCIVISNEKFTAPDLKNRGGTREDEKTLQAVFTRLGFTVYIMRNLTAKNILYNLRTLGKSNFMNHDALVVCVLSHGEKGCVFGTDGRQVLLRSLTEPFTSHVAPTLAGKPKLFFIQACQGSGYQGGARPPPPMPIPSSVLDMLEDDAGPLPNETVPWDADFLLGMATVPEYKSFRHTSTGSIYIQELCRQLTRSAESPEKEDILTVLTRVNREVGKGQYLKYKQMPEPKYTLTKRLVLKFV